MSCLEVFDGWANVVESGDQRAELERECVRVEATRPNGISREEWTAIVMMTAAAIAAELTKSWEIEPLDVEDYRKLLRCAMTQPADMPLREAMERTFREMFVD